MVKNLPANAGDAREPCLLSGYWNRFLFPRSRTSSSNGPHIFPLCLEWILPDATHHSLGRAVPCLAADKSSNLDQSFSGTFPTKTELYLTSAPLRAAKQRKHQLISSQCQCFPPAKRIQTGMLNYQVLRVTKRARESTDNVEPFILALTTNHLLLWLSKAWLSSPCFYSVTLSSQWRRQWHPTPVLLPGRSQGQRSLVGCSPWGH